MCFKHFGHRPTCLDYVLRSDVRPDVEWIKGTTNPPKKLHKTATTYINIEGVGFPVGEKPFEFKKGKQASGKKEVFVDKKYICYGGEGK